MITGKRFTAGTAQLDTTEAAVYTATNISAQVQACTLANTTAGAITVNVYLVPVGGSAANATTLLQSKSIGAHESYKCIELIGQWLSPGDAVWALASATNSIAMTMGGIEVS